MTLSNHDDHPRKGISLTGLAWALSDFYSAGGLGYLGLKAIFGDQLWPVALANNVAAWLMMLSLPLLGLAAARRRWRRAASLAVIAAAFVWLFGGLFAPRVTQSPVCAAPDDGCPVKLRVMAFNFLADSPDTGRVLAEIRRHDPDIVAVVEFSAERARDAERELGDVYPYQVQYKDGIPGIGLLSKYPIRDPEIFSMMPMGLSHLHAVVEVEGRPLDVYVAHPPPPGIGWDGRMPRYVVVGSPDIADLARRAGSGSPALLLGDFNISDISDDYRVIADAGLIDAFREAGYGLGVTWPVERFGTSVPPMVRIDYIWHTPDFSATRAWVGGRTGSDHLPVIADLVWDTE